ncbi:MAG: hypothetical protein WBA73_08330 [Devosia sp.]
MPRKDQVRLAATAWDYALRLCIRNLPNGPEREALIVCQLRPALRNIRAMLALGRGRPWLPLIESALVEIGLAAIEDILKEADHDHRS